MSAYSILLKDVENLETTLKCKVCNNIFNDPLLISKCGHTTCRSCFIGHFDMKCPVCDVPVNTKDSLEDKQMKDLLVQLENLKRIIFEDSKVENENILPTVENGKNNKSPIANAADGEIKTSMQDSTPVGRKRKTTLMKGTPNLVSSSEESIVQGTPKIVSGRRTVLSNSKKKQTMSSEKKRLNSNLSSPIVTNQSPTGNLNKKNHKGETLLHCAVIKGDIAKVKALLEEGALVNTQDNNGWTPLHEASNHGYLEIAKMLLDHGALVNVPSLKDNITPLHDALMNDKMPIAILLVSRGADLHVKTCFGNSALDLCKSDEDRNILIEACSPFISSSIPIKNVKVSPTNDNKIVFLSSNLNEIQKAQLQKCALLLKADVVDDFAPEVTHIITSCDNMGNCTRTLKILMGLLCGKWIMNFQWIEVCLEYKQNVDEEVFEVQGTKTQPNTQGPKLGRQNMQLKLPPLFDGFYFYLHGNFTSPTPEREDLCTLIHLGGGKILTREPRLETVASEPFMIPYHTPGTPLEDISHIILYQDNPPHGTQLHRGHICTTKVIWLIECISEFKILEVKQDEGNKK